MNHTSKAIPEGKFADIGDGLRIHYHELGDGFPLVFVHGSGPGASGYSNYKQNFPYFAERGFRCIVPDTLGFGYSSQPDDIDYDMDFVTGGLKKLLDSLGIERCALIGNSHGGAVCMQLALDHPELVARLVLMAPGGLEDTPAYMAMKGIRTMLAVFFSDEGITRSSMRKVFGLQLFDAQQITDQVIEERFQIAETQPKRVLASLRVPNMSERLADIGCPVFAWWGMNDLFCPVSGASTLAEQCPDVRVMLLGRCGHWVMVEHAALFNRLSCDFLRQGNTDG
jgi:4,5:9,10-diseco-3-hydroxy-5,9,17-trioxoandrosta-1(10),2-diene-4-oate hydrolase